MNYEMAEKVANSVLYEGYMLYPYRPSAIKNQQRWNFGTLYPPSFHEVREGTERSSMHTECVLRTTGDVQVGIRVRFLQLGVKPNEREWDQAVERAVELKVNVRDGASSEAFSFAGNGGSINGSVRATVASLDPGLFKLSIDLANESAGLLSNDRDHALSQSLMSAHMILHADGGEFISLLDPPAEMRWLISDCRNVGNFPVLVGEEGQSDMLLCSPIILYDYPQIAPESAGDFFDGTEMDEMLTLRVITLTDEEKEEMRSADDRVRAMLARTEQTAREQLARTHGAIRSMRQVNER